VDQISVRLRPINVDQIQQSMMMMPHQPRCTVEDLAAIFTKATLRDFRSNQNDRSIKNNEDNLSAILDLSHEFGFESLTAKLNILRQKLDYIRAVRSLTSTHRDSDFDFVINDIKFESNLTEATLLSPAVA
jgi:hypothetical protein